MKYIHRSLTNYPLHFQGAERLLFSNYIKYLLGSTKGLLVHWFPCDTQDKLVACIRNIIFSMLNIKVRKPRLSRQKIANIYCFYNL